MYNVSRAASDIVVLNLLCPFGRHVVFISFLTVTNNYILYIVRQLESPLDKLLFRITTVSAKHYIVCVAMLTTQILLQTSTL